MCMCLFRSGYTGVSGVGVERLHAGRGVLRMLLFVLHAHRSMRGHSGRMNLFGARDVLTVSVMHVPMVLLLLAAALTAA